MPKMKLPKGASVADFAAMNPMGMAAQGAAGLKSLWKIIAENPRPGNAGIQKLLKILPLAPLDAPKGVPPMGMTDDLLSKLGGRAKPQGSAFNKLSPAQAIQLHDEYMALSKSGSMANPGTTSPGVTSDLFDALRRKILGE